MTSTDGPFSEYGKRTEITHEDWTAALRESTILGLECTDCEWTTATPKVACNNCGSRQLNTVSLPTTGTVYSATNVQVSPAGFKTEYTIGLVSLGDTELLSRIESDVTIGSEVELIGTVEKDGASAPVFG